MVTAQDGYNIDAGEAIASTLTSISFAETKSAGLILDMTQIRNFDGETITSNDGSTITITNSTFPDFVTFAIPGCNQFIKMKTDHNTDFASLFTSMHHYFEKLHGPLDQLSATPSLDAALAAAQTEGIASAFYPVAEGDALSSSYPRAYTGNASPIGRT